MFCFTKQGLVNKLKAMGAGRPMEVKDGVAIMQLKRPIWALVVWGSRPFTERMVVKQIYVKQVFFGWDIFAVAPGRIFEFTIKSYKDIREYHKVQQKEKEAREGVDSFLRSLPCRIAQAKKDNYTKFA